MIQLAHTKTPHKVNRGASVFQNRIRHHSLLDRTPISPNHISKERLANQLASELWSRLPISRVANEAGDRGIEHTIRIATASNSQLSQWYRELAEFVPAIARAATEFRNDELTDRLRAELSAEIQQQMLEEIRYPLPGRSFVDFEFADLPPEDAWGEANRCLEQACLAFANQMLALFDTLQDKKLVGRIQDTTTSCRFSFFRRVAIIANTPKKTETRTRRDPNFQIPGHTVFLHETFQISDIDVQHRHVQFVHHVRNPVLNHPEFTEYPLPEKYRQLIDCCPDWMAGSLRVLEGQLFREEQIEWDLHTETRTDEKLIERVRRCPAVVFGPYILAGWGEIAIRDEEKRRADEQAESLKKTSAKQAQQLQWFSIVAAILAVAVIHYWGSATAATTSFAILIGLAAMALAGVAAHMKGAARDDVSASRVLLHSTLTGAAVFAIQGLYFSILYWALPMFGIVCSAAIISVIVSNKRRPETEWDGIRVG